MAMRTEPPLFDAKMYTNGVTYTSVDTDGNVLYTGSNAVTVFNSTVLYLYGLGGGLLLVLGGTYL
jgi:hypothetical protein